MIPPAPRALRARTIIARIRGASPRLAENLESSIDAIDCAKHGRCDDPILYVSHKGPPFVATFRCPWCVGGDDLATWKREGAS